MTNKQPLSTLQREILRIANKKEYVGYQDVLEQFYGFVPHQEEKSIFDRHPTIKETQAARVAICKSFNRLVLRGLVRRVHGENLIWHSITLLNKHG